MAKEELIKLLENALENANVDEKEIENVFKSAIINNELENIKDIFEEKKQNILYDRIYEVIIKSLWYEYIKKIKGKKEGIIISIFENIVLKNDYKFIKKEIDDDFFKRISETLLQVTYYSISNNYSENYFGEMVSEEIGVSEEYIDKLKKLYSEQFINLKLTYLIFINNDDN